MLLLKDAIAFGREEPANLLHRTRCRPIVLEKASEGWALNGSEAVRISLCGLTPRPSLGPLSALSTISSSHHAHPSMPLLAKIEQRWQKPDKGKLLLLRFDGSMVFEIPAPPLREGSPEWETPGYTDCRFDDRNGAAKASPCQASASGARSSPATASRDEHDGRRRSC